MGKPHAKAKNDREATQEDEGKPAPQAQERELTQREKFERLEGKYKAELSKPEAVEYFESLRKR